MTGRQSVTSSLAFPYHQRDGHRQQGMVFSDTSTAEPTMVREVCEANATRASVQMTPGTITEDGIVAIRATLDETRAPDRDGKGRNQIQFIAMRSPVLSSRFSTRPSQF
jgi:hypothetical protein